MTLLHLEKANHWHHLNNLSFHSGPARSACRSRKMAQDHKPGLSSTSPPSPPTRTPTDSSSKRPCPPGENECESEMLQRSKCCVCLLRPSEPLKNVFTHAPCHMPISSSVGASNSTSELPGHPNAPTLNSLLYYTLESTQALWISKHPEPALKRLLLRVGSRKWASSHPPAFVELRHLPQT